MNITKQELDILYHIKTKNGKSPYQANKEIKKIKQHLNILNIKLNSNKKLTPEQKNEKFKEAFHNLCQAC